MQFKNKLRLLVTVGAVAGSLSLGLVAPTVSGASSMPASTAKNTITFAEGATASPNYIFPYMSCAYFSVDNINQFQELMYRPLYWFGLGKSSAYVPKLSTGDKPVFSNKDKTITIDMKGWKFADGQTVNAQSVMFFLNLYKADPTNYCGYNKGYGIPDQVASATGKGNTVTIKFTGSVNPGWILYNYLSEITPLPDTWDITAPGKTSTCATGTYGAKATTTACLAVEKYLDALSSKESTYTDALWTSGTDGPWKLDAFDNLGNATFVPNSSYSGPVKAQKGIDYVKELAFTTATAEENDLRAGTVDLGYVDPTVLTANSPKPGVAGPNWSAIAGKYTLISGSSWAFNYAPFNFSPKDPKAAIVAQPYIREALQEAVNQTAIIQKVDKGYGFPIDSPLPPNTPTVISGLKSTSGVKNPYKYSLKSAKKLLSEHGWKKVGNVDECESPGTGMTDCGKGIAKGASLDFSIVWASGSPSLDDTFNAELSDFDSIGFNFSHTETGFNNVIADCEQGTKFELCSWGGGWSYAPDYYPSGETLFAPGGGFNVGTYDNATMTKAIQSTTYGTAKLAVYATAAADQLPVLYQPEAAFSTETINTLKSKIGFTPNPLQNFMPEYYHF